MEKPFFINTLDVEYAVASDWYDTVNIVNDPSNKGYGQLNYHIVVAGDGWDDSVFNKIGGQHIITKPKCMPAFTKTVSSNYTLDIQDQYRDSVRANVPSGTITITVPNSSDVNYDIGKKIYLMQTGAGQLIVAPASGVTINTPETLKARKQRSMIWIMKEGDNTWVAGGDLELL